MIGCRRKRAWRCWLLAGFAALSSLGPACSGVLAQEPAAAAVTHAVSSAGATSSARAVSSIAKAMPVDDDADQSNPHMWNPQTKSVAVFKNGLGFFLREGDVTLREGWCVAKEIPPAAFGTLAIYAKTDKQSVDIVGSGPGEVVEFDGRDAPKSLEAKRARLEACKAMRVQLHYRYKGQDRTAAGKLVSVGPEFVVLEDSQSYAVPLAGVVKLQMLDLPLRVHVASDPKSPAADRVTLGMGYLRKGIVWIPDYTLQIIDEENAELTLRGTVINEAEDLVHTDVHLVVGVPHFMHTEYMAPIAVGQVVRTIGAAAVAGVPQQVASQIMSRAAITSNNSTNPATAFSSGSDVVLQPIAPAGGDLAAATGNLPKFDAAASTDYTVYTKKDLTLRRGEKAIVTLFTQRIRYGHVYRWTIPAKIEHALVLHNAGDSAWTTGPCLALSGGSPLSEDLLQYVPKSGRGEFPVATAINVAHEKTEREIERKLKAHSPSEHVYFDLVTLEGTLKLRNFEKRTIELFIANPIPGKPLSADAEGVVSVDSNKLKLLEREGQIVWRMKIDAGAAKTVTYRYERYVPSN